MAARIVVHHLSGSKVNRVEQFPLDAYGELTIGRDADSTIQYDAVRDDAVSRRHASIKVQPGDTPTFMLNDIGSSNGTLLNGERISGEAELLPGDQIELGVGGPKFAFDIEPRSANFVARTRMTTAPAAPRTRLIDVTGDSPTTAKPEDQAAKPVVGRNTVLHMLSEQRQRASRVGMYALAGVLVVIGAAGVALYYSNERSRAAQEANAAAERIATDQKIKAAAQEAEEHNAAVEKRSADLKEKIGISTQDIAAQFSSATVKIHTRWRLIDKTTNKPLYHKMVKLDDNYVPLYVLTSDHGIVRWLTTDDDKGVNDPVGGEGQGTGFVVTIDGFILTNKHVAAPWKTNYEFGRYEQGKALLVPEISGMPHSQREFKAAENDTVAEMKTFGPTQAGRISKELHDWVPEGEGVVFDNRIPVRIGPKSTAFEGVSEALDVQFPGNTTSFKVDRVSASDTADVALVKMSVPQPLNTVALAQDDNVRVGERIVVLGYPGISQQKYRISKTLGDKVGEAIPETTVTDGVISSIGSPLTEERGSIVGSDVGHAYQLSDISTGHGNSGGPVFDAKGRVIALFTFVVAQGSERATFAVPIKYGRELMSAQR
jgi:serine protease Do